MKNSKSDNQNEGSTTFHVFITFSEKNLSPCQKLPYVKDNLNFNFTENFWYESKIVKISHCAFYSTFVNFLLMIPSLDLTVPSGIGQPSLYMSSMFSTCFYVKNEQMSLKLKVKRLIASKKYQFSRKTRSCFTLHIHNSKIFVRLLTAVTLFSKKVNFTEILQNILY